MQIFQNLKTSQIWNTSEPKHFGPGYSACTCIEGLNKICAPSKQEVYSQGVFSSNVSSQVYLLSYVSSPQVSFALSSKCLSSEVRRPLGSSPGFTHGWACTMYLTFEFPFPPYPWKIKDISHYIEIFERMPWVCLVHWKCSRNDSIHSLYYKVVPTCLFSCFL
jgi:hypothetical protein